MHDKQTNSLLLFSGWIGPELYLLLTACSSVVVLHLIRQSACDLMTYLLPQYGFPGAVDWTFNFKISTGGQEMKQIVLWGKCMATLPTVVNFSFLSDWALCGMTTVLQTTSVPSLIAVLWDRKMPRGRASQFWTRMGECVIACSPEVFRQLLLGFFCDTLLWYSWVWNDPCLSEIYTPKRYPLTIVLKNDTLTLSGLGLAILGLTDWWTVQWIKDKCHTSVYDFFKFKCLWILLYWLG